MITNGNSSFASLSACKVGGFVTVMVNATANVSDSVSSRKTVGTPVYGQAFGLERLLKSSDMMGNLSGFGMVGVEVLNFAL